MTDEPTIPTHAEAAPSEPPPIPPAPLAYAGPMPPPEPSGKLNFYQQAAKVSWLAPIFAIVIGFTVSFTKHGLGDRQDAWARTFVAIVDASLIFTGLLLGVLSLIGARRYGKYKILTPAIVGLCINGAIIAATASFFLADRRASSAIAKRTLASVSAPMPVPMTRQEVQDSFEKATGWVGHSKPGAPPVIFVASINPRTPLGRELSDLFGTDLYAMDIVVDNSKGEEPITVKAEDLILVLDDGKNVTGARVPGEVFAGTRLDASVLKSAYPPTANLRARDPNPAHMLAFFPIDVNPDRIDHAVLFLDTKLVSIPGRLQTREDKLANILRANAATTLPATP